jgi:hypothetical protein
VCRGPTALAAVLLILSAAERARADQDLVVRQEAGRVSAGVAIGGGPPGQITADAVALGTFNPGPVVKGAPYSAEGTTEVVQTFPDGNRIVRRTSTSLYRDSRGRIRREVELGNVAGIVVTGSPLRIITIHDPDSRTTHIVDGDRRMVRVGGPGPSAGAVQLGGDIAPPVAPSTSGNEREESLGTRTIEGLVCEGTRRTTTIPAGAIGNERPMTTVTERWVARELQLLVLSRVSDPRFGDTTYRLTKIVRAEPSASLFEVPR